MLGASGPTSQKDWYPHPKNGLRAISEFAKSHIIVRPVKVGSPNRILDRRSTLKPDTLQKAAKQIGIDNSRIAGEMRVVFLIINVNPARDGARRARPIDVLELLKMSSEVAMTTTTIPDVRRRPG